MGKIVLITAFIIATLQLSGQKLGISFDKHTLIILEGMHLTRPLDNTCGMTKLGDGSLDYNIRIDSIDLHHIRVQANAEFYDCNFSFFTNKGILSIEAIFDNETDKLFEVYRPEDLVYKYTEEMESASIKPGSKKVTGSINSDIQIVFDSITAPDFRYASETDLVEFTVTNIISHAQYIYIMMVVNNKSAIDYEISGVIFSQTIKNRSNKAGQNDVDYLKLVDKIEPEGSKIKAGEYEVLCYQLEKFTLTSKNELHIDFNEKDGRRKDQIIIKRNFFNRNTRNL